MFVESYNLETFQNGTGKVRRAILMKGKRQRLELHPNQGWKAMQGWKRFFPRYSAEPSTKQTSDAAGPMGPTELWGLANGTSQQPGRAHSTAEKDRGSPGENYASKGNNERLANGLEGV